MPSEDVPNYSQTQAVPTNKDINRWKAVVGSSSWKKYRQSRRKILRQNCSIRNASSAITKEETTLFDSHDDLLKNAEDERETLITTNVATTKENQKEISNNSNQNHHNAFKISSSLYSSGISSHDYRCTENNENLVGEQPTRLEYEASQPDIYTKIQILERHLEEQEDEINSLENEIKGIIKKNEEDVETLQKKRQALRNNEDRYTSLKMKLAEVLEDKDNIQFEVSQVIAVRNLNTINLTNEINQLRVIVRNFEKKNRHDFKKLKKLKKLNEQREIRLLNIQGEIELLKHEKTEARKRYFLKVF